MFTCQEANCDCLKTSDAPCNLEDCPCDGCQAMLGEMENYTSLGVESVEAPASDEGRTNRPFTREEDELLMGFANGAIAILKDVALEGYERLFVVKPNLAVHIVRHSRGLTARGYRRNIATEQLTDETIITLL